MKSSVVSLRLLLIVAASGSPSTGTHLNIPAVIRNPFNISGTATGNLVQGFDSQGNIYLAGQFFGAIPSTGFPVAAKTILGTPAPAGSPSMFVLKISPSGDRLLNLTEINDSNAEDDRFGGMEVEPDGSVVLTGGTRATDFPTTPGSFQPHATKGGAFLLKLDPSGQKIVFSTYLDDSISTAADSITLGPDGSYYVGGSTDGKTFPTTNGAYRQSVPAGASYAGFVSHFSADGKTLLASTLFNNAISAFSVSVFDGGGSQIKADATGAIHFLGSASINVFDASLSQLSVSKPIDSPFLLQIDTEGNSYIVGSYVLGSQSTLTKLSPTGALLNTIQIPPFFVAGFTVLDDGSIVLAGSGPAVNFPTQNTLMPCNMNVPHDTVPVQWWLQSAAIIVLDAGGSVVNASFMGGGAPAGWGNDSNSFGTVTKDGTGVVHLTGSSPSPEFPGGPLLIPGPAKFSSFSFALDLGALPRGRGAVPACLAFSAPWGRVEAPVVPAMFMTLFGSNLGPVVGVSSQPNKDQSVPREVAGIRLTVGGLPAPILYAQERQIDFIVPHGVTGPATEVCVTRNDADRNTIQSCLFAYVGDRDGAMLSGVLNEDGSVNSAANPASPGSVVSFFGIGFGIFDPNIADGAITQAAFVSSRFSMEANVTYFNKVDGTEEAETVPADVVYFGAAPGLLNGVAQMNVRLPGGFGPPTTMSAQIKGGTVPAFPLLPAPVLVYIGGP